MALPVVVAVKLTWHAPLMTNRMHLGGENVPVTPVMLKVTVPVGVVAPAPAVSPTIPIQVAPWPTAIVVGKQKSVVEVVPVPSPNTVTVTVVGLVVGPRGDPVTWKLYEPGGTEESITMNKPLVAPVEVGVTGLPPKAAQVTPVGRPEQDNVTG
jgi:hypothetical protein